MLSIIAFKFSLRHYTMGFKKFPADEQDLPISVVGQCRLTLSKPRGKRLELSA
jgi:hypothetical protein